MLPTLPPAPSPDPEVLFSMPAMRRAWQQVRRSGDTPGSDGVSLRDFHERVDIELNRLRQQVLSGMYQPQPVRRFYLKKASGGHRPIAIWSLRDRIAQRVAHDYLLTIFDAMFLPCSFGFRPGRTREQAISAIIAGRDAGLRWVLDADIADCFGSIPIRPLLAQVKRAAGSTLVVKLVDQWLHTPVLGERRAVAGVSQGGVISPLLANLYLHRFDEMITAALPEARLIRFADDFVILSGKRAEAIWSLDVARRSLKNLRLTLHPDKTRIVHFNDTFQFLGVQFNGIREVVPLISVLPPHLPTDSSEEQPRCP